MIKEIYLLFFFIFFTLVFLSCNHTHNKSASKKGIVKEIATNQPSECLISPKTKLFLNFWAGMTKNDYHCILHLTIKSNLLIKKNNDVFYLLNTDYLKLEPYFENGLLTKLTLSYKMLLPSEIASEQFEYEKNGERFTKLQLELIKKYGKPYLENYNILSSEAHGSFWKTNKKVIVFNVEDGILSYIDLKYVNKLAENKILKEKQIEQKHLDQLRNL